MNPRRRADRGTARVLIVDDDVRVLETLERWIDAQRDMTVVGQATDGIRALSLVEGLGPDVIVLDVKLPGMTGLEILRRLRKAGNATPVVVLSADERCADDATGLDAAFLAKGRAGAQDVVAAIRSRVGVE